MDNGVSLAGIRREATLKANCDTYGIEYTISFLPQTRQRMSERQDIDIFDCLHKLCLYEA